MNSPSINTGSGFCMFDALLVLSRNICLLIAGPLIVAALVVGALLALPARFTSHAILVLPKTPAVEAGLAPGSGGAWFVPTALQATAVMKSPIVLDQVLLVMYPGSATPEDSARDALAASIKTTVVKDGSIRLEVTSATALKAQKIANLVIDAWLRATQPTAQQQAELEKRLTHARQTLLAAQTMAASQKTPLLYLAGWGDLLGRYFGQTLEIERQMYGLTRDVVVQPPTLATRTLETPYIPVFFQVMFAPEFFFVVWVLGRRALEVARENPDTAQKLEKLRESLCGGRGKANSV